MIEPNMWKWIVTLLIKKKIDGGIVSTAYVHTDQQLANILTKRLFERVFDILVNKLGLDIYSLAWGVVLTGTT